MEISLSIEYDNMHVNGSWCSHSFCKIDCFTKCTNYLSVKYTVCVSLLDNWVTRYGMYMGPLYGLL